MEAHPGLRLGRYVLGRRLGSGGMAEVWEALDELLRRQVAVKLIRPHLSETADFTSRFLREARLAARFHHPNVVPVYDVGSEGGTLFVVMPVLPGGTLADRLGGEIPDGTALAWLETLASVLDVAHGMGIVHRDVKPQNVMFDAAGTLLLSDFGLAKSVDETTIMTEHGAVLGTPVYMSPEQVMGQRAGPPADQYALGVLAYRLLAGRLPMDRLPTPVILQRTAYEALPAPSTFRPTLPPPVDAVFAQVLAKSPNLRFASCSDFARELRDAMEGRRGGTETTRTAPAAGWVPTLQAPAAGARRVPLAALAIGCVFTATLGLSAWLSFYGGQPPGRRAVKPTPEAPVASALPALPFPADQRTPSPSSSPSPTPSPFPTPAAAPSPAPSPTPLPRATPSPAPAQSPRAAATTRLRGAAPLTHGFRSYRWGDPPPTGSVISRKTWPDIEARTIPDEPLAIEGLPVSAISFGYAMNRLFSVTVLTTDPDALEAILLKGWGPGALEPNPNGTKDRVWRYVAAGRTTFAVLERKPAGNPSALTITDAETLKGTQAGGAPAVAPTPRPSPSPLPTRPASAPPPPSAPPGPGAEDDPLADFARSPYPPTMKIADAWTEHTKGGTTILVFRFTEKLQGKKADGVGGFGSLSVLTRGSASLLPGTRAPYFLFCRGLDSNLVRCAVPGPEAQWSGSNKLRSEDRVSVRAILSGFSFSATLRVE